MKKWEQLTKEQKQLCVMGVILGCIVIFLFIQFGLSPFLASKAHMTEDYEKLKTDLDQAALAIKGETQLNDTLNDKTRLLEQAYRDYIPLPDNPLSWATKRIYGDARAVGVDIESVSEISGEGTRWMAKDQIKRAFKPYAVRVSTQCSYAELIRLVRELEKNNPHMFISDISVQAMDADNIKHIVSLIVEWPSWKTLDRIPAFASSGGDDADKKGGS